MHETSILSYVLGVLEWLGVLPILRGVLIFLVAVAAFNALRRALSGNQ